MPHPPSPPHNHTHESMFGNHLNLGVGLGNANFVAGTYYAFMLPLCYIHSESPNRIVSEVVVNFPNNLDEVTLIAEPECVRLKNYVEDDGKFYRW